MTRADRQDVGLALGVAVLGQVDVLWPGVFSTNLVGPTWFVSLTYLVAALALVLRRRRPGTTFAVVAATLLLQALTVGPSEGNGSFFPAVVATYSVAAHGQRRVAFAALAALPVVVAVRELTNPTNTTWHATVNALGWDLVLPAAWLLGAYLRTRRQLVAELRQHAAEAAESAAAAERARIARELHDVVAHSLSVIVVQAEAAEEVLAHDPARVAAPLHAIQRTGRDTLAEMRRLLGVLHADEPAREPAPGAAAVPELVRRVRAAGLPVELEVRGRLDGLPAGADLAVYRIVQESLTNALKHAGASRVQVLVERREDDVRVDVVDDGRGAASPPRTGNGLLGMRERVAAHGGSFDAGPVRPHGFAVRARLALDVTS